MPVWPHPFCQKLNSLFKCCARCQYFEFEDAEATISFTTVGKAIRGSSGKMDNVFDMVPNEGIHVSDHGDWWGVAREVNWRK